MVHPRPGSGFHEGYRSKSYPILFVRVCLSEFVCAFSSEPACTSPGCGQTSQASFSESAHPSLRGQRVGAWTPCGGGRRRGRGLLRAGGAGAWEGMRLGGCEAAEGGGASAPQVGGGGRGL